MSKSKNNDNKKKKTGSSTKAALKKDQSSTTNLAGPCVTWIGAGYQFYSLVRICKSVANYANPATYIHSVKEDIVLPVVKRNCTEDAQNIVGASIEVLEFLISPTRYILNIVSYTVAEKTGKIVKQNFMIKHPELRAGVDVVFNEAAFQATKIMSTSTEKKFSGMRFFKGWFSAEKIPHKMLSTSLQFRSKL